MIANAYAKLWVDVVAAGEGREEISVALTVTK